MKNLFIISFFLLSISVYGQKQYFGIIGGLSFTNLSISGDEEKKGFRTGFNGGLTYQYEFKNKFRFEIDAVYAQKGAKQVDSSPIQPVNYKNSVVNYNFDYISLPLKVGYSVGDRIGGFLNVGIVPSFLVSTRLKNPEFNVVFSNGDIGILNDLSKFDLSGLVEIGWNYKIHDRLSIFNRLAYQYSISDLMNDSELYNSDVRHYGVIFFAGVKFVIGE